MSIHRIEKPFELHFPTIFMCHDHEGVDDLNNKLYNFCKKIANENEDDSEGNPGITTVGAVQPRVNLLVDYYQEEPIKSLMKEIIEPGMNRWVNEHWRRLHGHFAPDNVGFNMYSWCTFYKAGDFQTPHVHRGRLFTGIYYVKMPKNIKDPHEGALGLLNPHVESAYPRSRSTWTTELKHPPREGQLVIIPSWYQHYVMPHKSKDEDRLVIVFDCEYDFVE